MRATGDGGVTGRVWQKLLLHRPPPVSRVPGAGEGDGGRRRGAHEKQPQRVSATAEPRAASAGLRSLLGIGGCGAAGVILGGAGESGPFRATLLATAPYSRR